MIEIRCKYCYGTEFEVKRDLFRRTQKFVCRLCKTPDWIAAAGSAGRDEDKEEHKQ